MEETAIIRCTNCLKEWKQRVEMYGKKTIVRCPRCKELLELEEICLK